MRRFLAIASCVVLFGGALFARGGMRPLSQPVPSPLPGAARQQPGQPAPPASGGTRIIDLKSDLSGPVAPGDSVIFLVGNFAAQHNGAVITSDSAVRYSDKRIEFFGNVLINKNTTYIYGDRADYDGETNEARIYSPIIKVVDGDATLYTYEFRFDTQANVGEFAGGGVLTNRDNVLESERGYFYADTKDLVAVGQVEMRSEEYELKGDSVVYNMDSDNAYFFDRTNIWSRDGDYLYADRGEYRKADTLYVVTRSGYVLTAGQEMWSDSIDFFRARNHVILRRNIQLDDVPHKVLAFGDYGEYWKVPGNALLTRRPAVVSYDLSQGDSLFMRADSILLHTLRWGEEVAQKGKSVGKDSVAQVPGIPGDAAGPRRVAVDSLGQLAAADSLRQVVVPDSLAVDSLAVADSVRTLTSAELKARQKEEARQAAEARKRARAAEKKRLLAEIAARRQAKATAKLEKQKKREEARRAAQRLKAESKLRARQARAARKGKLLSAADSAATPDSDSVRMARAAARRDSVFRLLYEEWRSDSLAMGSDSLPLMHDSVYRLLRGYRNVRIYRSDFQSVCDSMTAVSTDSTIRLRIDPVLWNEQNQITSDKMDIYTRNQELEHADFVGTPMMANRLDSIHYNQIAGKEMTAYFRDNRIWLNRVKGNARTLYYNQDGEPPEITGLFFIESGGIDFYVEDNQVVRMVWTNEPSYTIDPIDKLPPDRELYLKGFKWEGARRPALSDVFDRHIRPSERTEREALEHPDFPLQRRIDAHRRELVEQRRWADRVDQVDPHTAEWMRSLGFEVGQPRTDGPQF